VTDEKTESANLPTPGANTDEVAAFPKLSDDELGRRIVQILRSPVYETAREAMIAYETAEGERASSAILEMRDALDHLIVGARSGDSGKLKEAEEHLRRAAVEPAQDMVESRLARITSSLRLYSIRRVLFPGLPNHENVDQRLSEIKRHLKIGRELKAKAGSAVSAVEHFVKAHAEAVSLDEALHRAPLAWWLRLGLGWGVPVGLAIVGIVLMLTS